MLEEEGEVKEEKCDKEIKQISSKKSDARFDSLNLT